LNQTFQSRLGISTTTDTLDSAPSSRMTAPPPPTREAAAAAAASLMPTRQTQGPVIPIDLQAGDAVAELTPLGGESLLPVATLAGGRLGEVAEPLPQRPPDPEMFGIFSPPAPISAMPQIIDPWTAFGLAALALAARQNRLAERTRPAYDGR
jgi:hypothetical protein